MKHLHLLLVIIISFLLRCTSSQIAGGTGTETTNSFAYLRSGVPAVHCRILLINSEKWKEKAYNGDFIIDSALSGMDGSFSFKYDRVLSNLKVNVQIDHDSAGLFRREMTYATMNSSPFILNKYSVLRGSVADSTRTVSVLVEGTSYNAHVGGDGTFEQKIPEGTYALFIKDDSTCRSGGSITVPEGSEVDVALPHYAAQELLITDFESGYYAPCMQAEGVSVFWYLYSDSAAKSYVYGQQAWVVDTSTFVKQGNTSVTSLIEKNGESNHSLKIDVLLDRSYSVPYGGLGLVLYTENDAGMDFSNYKSFKFDIQGQGTIKVILIVKHPVHDGDVRFSYVLPLSTQKNPAVIDFDKFQIDSGTEDSLRISWEEAKKRVRLIEFGFFKSENMVSTVVNATIDNIVLIGNGTAK